MKSLAASRSVDTAPAALLWCVMGLLVPRATLFGELTPFGIGLAACGGAANLPTMVCLCVGYLLARPVWHPLRYLAAVAMVGAIRWVLAAVPEWQRRRFVPPLLAFVGCAATGMLLLSRSGADPYRTLLVVAESGVAAGAALFLDVGMDSLYDGWGDTTHQTQRILTGAVVVMATATVEVGGFAPGRVAAAFLVLLLSRSGRESGGSIAGCVLGGAMALAIPGQTAVAVSLALGGLVAGLFSRFGRWCQSALFLLTAGVVTLGETDERTLIYLGEIALAGVLFALLPREWDRRLGRLFIRSRDLPAVEGVRRLAVMQLQVASGALTEVAESVDTVTRRLDRHGWQGQFVGTGELLQGLAARLEDRDLVDVELSEQIAAVCRDYGMAVVDALCTRDSGNRLTVDILTRDTGVPPGVRWRRQMDRVCGRRFAPPVESRWGDRVRITLAEPPRYRVESGIARRQSRGETLCGDAVQIDRGGGSVVAVLSDGMGSGGLAAVDGAMAAGIAARLWSAGFSPVAVMQTVNAALLVKSREESLATLDVIQIDTHSGRLDSYKAGAAPTLLRSGGRVSRWDRPGLPLGILSQVSWEHTHDWLSDGDVLLMVSDGALTGGVAAVEEVLRDFPTEGSMADLARAVVDAAQAAEGERSDDITAVALRICRAAPPSRNL